MEILIGLQGLERELAELPKRDQILHVDLDGRDPDDGMTSVPYDKGAAFLRRLEEVFGRARFDTFLQGWFASHAFQSVTTEDFLSWLDRELLSHFPVHAEEIDVGDWVNGPGLPADTPRPHSKAFDRVDAARTAWLSGGDAARLDTDGWVTMQWIHFLDGVPKDVPESKLEELDAAHDLTGVGNSEVLVAWLKLNLRAGWERTPVAVRERLERFLMRVGRRKFLEPLYKAMAQTPEGLARAREIYAAARPRYHSVSAHTIDGILGWPQ